MLEQVNRNRTAAERFRAAYRHYCWPVLDVNDLKLAPFHLLATEGVTHTDKPHLWHLEALRNHLTETPSPVLHATRYEQVDLDRAESVEAVMRWWEALTSEGGEGMVVKPLELVFKGKRGLAQPAVKMRGREYLYIIYGPEYTLPGNLSRLRSRNVGAKRSLASREFALGPEALRRFTAGEPLRRAPSWQKMSARLIVGSCYLQNAGGANWGSRRALWRTPAKT